MNIYNQLAIPKFLNANITNNMEYNVTFEIILLNNYLNINIIVCVCVLNLIFVYFYSGWAIGNLPA